MSQATAPTFADHICFDRPHSGLQRLAARFGGHAFDLHRHETYAVGVTSWGVQSFHYRGALHTSRAGQAIVLHPDEQHDGHAGADQGFAYRMLYIDPALIGAALDGASPPFVPKAVACDPAVADLLDEAFVDFPRPLEPLARDAAVCRLAELLMARSDGAKPPKRSATAYLAATRAREFLAAEASRLVTSEDLEIVSGLDRFALSRHFRAAFGTSPHRFQVGQRLAQAQAMIAAGVPLSQAAVATGFADQSHLTRHFSARFGLTPGRWAMLARV